MSGVAGGNRIERGDVQATFNKYVDEVLKSIPGFKKASLSGSVKAGSKPDFGDLDIIVWFEGDDKREVKQRLIDAITKLPSNIIVPFKSEKYAGKRYHNAGELISVLFPIEGKTDEYIQVDNIISLSEEEHAFKGSFLDLPAEKQGLLIGLAKVILLEENPEEVFRRMGIKDVPKLKRGEEYEFNLSSVKLSLRKVKLKDFKEVAREEVWSTTNWGTIKILFKNFNIDGSFEDLLDDIARKLTNARSKNRIAGIFRSMVTVKSGEVGTAKGKGKEDALEKVAQTLSEAIDDQSITVALYAGGFKPPHKAHYENARLLSQNADKLIIFIGSKIREGVKITAEQSKAIWEIYAKYLATPVEIHISPITPIKDIYDWVDQHHSEVDKIITGTMADERAKFSYFDKNKGKYPKVEIKELPVIVAKEDDKFSATEIRKSEEYLTSGKWIPSVVSKEDKQAIIDIVTPEKEPSVEDKMLSTVDEVFESFFPSKKHDLYLDEGKFAFEKPLSSYFQKALHEITLSKGNAVRIQGGTMSGTFSVGDFKYRYSIAPFAKSPYEDDGSFYNIAFHPISNKVSTPQGGKENYVKILSTMYKIIMDFIEKHQPEYIGIGSLDNEEGRSYHTVYASLTDNKANRIPGYFRKDVSIPFNSPEGPGKMVVLKKKREVNPLEEGSSGVPIMPSAAIPSKDRTKLEDLYDELIKVIDGDEFNLEFLQDKIAITNKAVGQIGFDYTPIQKRLPEGVEQEKFDYTPYIGSLLEYMLDEKMNIIPLPEVKIRYDEDQANDFFGKTAYYDPNNKEVVLYVMGRHPKDVCRSFSHEMIHHMQNMEGRLGDIHTTNTNEDDRLQELEKEAYLKGNITFRNWEDGIKNGVKKGEQFIAEGRYDKISNQASSDLFRAWKTGYDQGEKSLSFEDTYSNGDVEFDVEGYLMLTPGTGKMEVLDSTGAGFDDDGDFIIINIAIDPELLPSFWEEISMTLKDLFRHEIEHLTHNKGGVSTNLSKIMRGDLAKRNKIKAGEKPIGDYFKLKKEIDANLQGMYFRAKKEKRPFADVVNTYLDAQKITPEEKEEILTLWRKRLPALGVKQSI